MSQLPFPERVLHQHIATLGKTGAGKSSAMRVIAEHLLDKNRRIAIVDPKGDWWGLKSSANGKSAGYPIITFGNFKEERATDVPINERSGKQVAELIATGNRPCVLGFRGWMPGQLTKFWLDFAPAIFNMNEGELYVIIDEVHNFAPKGKIMDPDSGKCLHWTNRIMSEGRGLGLTFFIASQRPQKVHNDTLDCCETLVAMRVAHPAARQSIKDWIDGNGDKEKGKEVLDTLAQLKRGEAWIWSPENGFGPERAQFPMFQTFDSFAPPQLQKKVNQAGWSEVNLDQVREKLAAVIAEQKANDPKELKAQIAQLRAELVKKSSETVKTAPIVDEKAIERAVKAATTQLRKQLGDAMKIIAKIEAIGFEAAGITKEEVQKAIDAAVAQITRLAEQKITNRAAEFDRLKREASTTLERLEKVLADEQIDVSAIVQHRESFAVTTRPAPTSRSVAIPTNGDSNLTGPERKILRALGELLSIGKETPPKNMVAAWSGYSPLGGAFGNPIGALRSKGLIDYPQPGTVTLTEAGRATIGPCSPPDQQEIWRRIENTCTGPEQKILRALIDNAGAGEIAKEQLAAKAGYSPIGGAFGNPVGALRTKGLLDYPRQGVVKAADWLFL